MPGCCPLHIDAGSRRDWRLVLRTGSPKVPARALDYSRPKQLIGIIEMQQSRTYAPSVWREARAELAALFLLTAIAVAHLFDLHWVMAMGVSPLVMLAFLASIYVLVEVLWFAVIGLEKLGTLFGIRKSPLS